MKVAVSIPDDVFAEAELVAARHGVSRSELYATALRVLLRDDAATTERLNEVYASADNDDNTEFVAVAARRVAENTAW